MLNVWFHKGRISQWNSATGMRQSSVLKWSKSGQTEADWQWNSAERGKSAKPKAGDAFLN